MSPEKKFKNHSRIAEACCASLCTECKHLEQKESSQRTERRPCTAKCGAHDLEGIATPLHTHPTPPHPTPPDFQNPPPSLSPSLPQVYVVLKQVDDAEKRLRGKKDTATASAHEALSTEQRTLVSALAELEGGTRKGSLAEEETKTSKRRKTAEGSRGVSPRVRKPQKAPVPPISIAELRLKYGSFTKKSLFFF